MWAEKVLLKNGEERVRFVERYTNYLTGKTERVQVVCDKDTNATRKAAERILQDKISEKLVTKQKSSAYTIQDIYIRYMEYQKIHVKPSTYGRNVSILNTVIKILNPNVLADRITAAYVDKRFPDTPTKYNTYLTRFKAMIRWAYDHDMISSAEWLSKLHPLPDNRKERIQDKYLEKEELSRVLDSMKIEKWKLLTEFLALSGLRIGELVALNKEDVDLREHLIRINKTYVFHMGIVESSAKTEDSNRNISIQKELEQVVHSINHMVANYTVIGLNHGTSIFFPDEEGGYLHYDSYRQYFGDVTERVIGRRLTPHALRHTMTSLMAEAGIPLETISRRLGHKDSEITRDIYLHITKKMAQHDAELMKNVRLLNG